MPEIMQIDGLDLEELNAATGMPGGTTVLPSGQTVGQDSAASIRSYYEQNKSMFIAMSVASTAAGIAGAYHGYKRNNSVGWAVGWFFLGSLFWPITVPVMLAQGFGKRAGGLSGLENRKWYSKRSQWRLPKWYVCDFGGLSPSNVEVKREGRLFVARRLTWDGHGTGKIGKSKRLRDALKQIGVLKIVRTGR